MKIPVTFHCTKNKDGYWFLSVDVRDKKDWTLQVYNSKPSPAVLRREKHLVLDGLHLAGTGDVYEEVQE